MLHQLRSRRHRSVAIGLACLCLAGTLLMPAAPADAQVFRDRQRLVTDPPRVADPVAPVTPRTVEPRQPGPRLNDRDLQIGIGIIDGIVRALPDEPPRRVRDCPPGTEFSPRSGRCIEFDPPPRRATLCDPGFRLRNGRCLPDVDTPPPRRNPPRVTPAGPAIDVVRVQGCLNKLGFDAGPVDGALGRRTFNAFVAFQGANGLADRPNAVGDEVTLKALFDRCDRPAEAAAPLAPEPPPVDVAAVGPATPIPDGDRCVDPDLYDLLKEAYGERPGIRPCASACLPRPAFLSPAQLTDLAAKENVSWCEACIQLGAYLPLASVLEIEKAAKVTLCASPPPACFLPGRPVVQIQREVRTLFRNLPLTVEHDRDVAVIVGNDDYGNALPPNANGQSDADAVKELLTTQLGYRAENIIDLRNATMADLRRVFGTETQAGEVQARLGKPEDHDLFIYVAAHGISSPVDNAAFLLPVDASTDDIAGTALPLEALYQQLGRIGARTTLLAMEATFAHSVTQLISPPNLPEREVTAMPESPVPGLAVLKASDRDQQALQDPEFGIGLFTRYLISGLAGEADASPVGNGDKRIDTVELFVYASDMVRTAARKSFGLEQKPLLSRIDNLLIGKLAQN